MGLHYVIGSQACFWSNKETHLHRTMELSESLVCPCNNRVYSSRATLLTHKKSGTHRLWEMPNTIRDLNIRVNRLENENGQLKRDVERLESLNQIPKARIRTKVLLGEKIKSFVQLYDVKTTC